MGTSKQENRMSTSSNNPTNNPANDPANNPTGNWVPTRPGTWESHHAITGLMFLYTERIDAGDFEGLGAIFANAAITADGTDIEVRGAEAVADYYRSMNVVHPDGTLRTRHLAVNVITDIDEDAGTATARSGFVVLQQTPALPLQPIVTGRYRDRFTRVDGVWQFTQRHMMVDHVGDVSEHLSFDLAAFIAGT